MNLNKDGQFMKLTNEKDIERRSRLIYSIYRPGFSMKRAEIAQAAGQRSGASMNAQPTMLSSGSSGGNSVGNSHTTVTNTENGSSLPKHSLNSSLVTHFIHSFGILLSFKKFNRLTIPLFFSVFF